MVIEVNIQKPLYGTFCYIRDIYIEKAIKYRCSLRVTIPQGTADVDPKWWRDTGKLMKKVFNDPVHPMILYGNHLPIYKKEEMLEGFQPKLF